MCEPSIFVVDKPVPKRILSLVRHTVDIVKAKLKRGFLTSTKRVTAIQENVCADLRNMLKERPDGACWSSPPLLTLPERIFCREIRFPICENGDHQAQDRVVSPPMASPIAVKAAVGARQRERRRNDRIFVDLSETDHF